MSSQPPPPGQSDQPESSPGGPNYGQPSPPTQPVPPSPPSYGQPSAPSYGSSPASSPTPSSPSGSPSPSYGQPSQPSAPSYGQPSSPSYGQPTQPTPTQGPGQGPGRGPSGPGGPGGPPPQGGWGGPSPSPWGQQPGQQGQHGQPGSASPYGYGGPTAPASPSGPSFFSKLFDLSFSSFVTPSIVKIVYVLALIVIGLAWLVYIVVGFSQGVGLGLAALVGGAVVALVYVVLARIGLEFYLAVFRIAEDVRELKDTRSKS